LWVVYIKKKMSALSHFGKFECGQEKIHVQKLTAGKVCTAELFATRGLPQSYSFGGVVGQSDNTDFRPNGESTSTLVTNPEISSHAVGEACRLVGVSWVVFNQDLLSSDDFQHFTVSVSTVDSPPVSQDVELSTIRGYYVFPIQAEVPSAGYVTVSKGTMSSINSGVFTVHFK